MKSWKHIVGRNFCALTNKKKLKKIDDKIFNKTHIIDAYRDKKKRRCVSIWGLENIGKRSHNGLKHIKFLNSNSVTTFSSMETKEQSL